MSGAPVSGAREPGAAPRVVHLEVPRTARLQLLGDPATARTLWVALHGYGQLAEYFARPFVEALPADACVVVPEALSRFYLSGTGAPGARIGATWMTREDRLAEIADYVRYLDRALDAVLAGRAVGAVRLCVLGFSQGATTACRWLAHRHAHGLAPAARLVLWGGGVPPDLDAPGDGREAVLRATPLTLVVGDADEYVTPEAVAEQERGLAAGAVPYTLVRYAGTHRVPPEVLRAVLREALQAEPESPPRGAPTGR